MYMETTLQPKVKNGAGVSVAFCDIDVRLEIDKYSYEPEDLFVNQVWVDIPDEVNGVVVWAWVDAPAWVYGLAKVWFDENYDDVCTRYREYLADST